MAGAHRSSKGSGLDIGGVPLQKNSWEVDQKGDDLETTTFEDNGFSTGIIGIESCDVKIGGAWDADANDIDDPPGLFPRSDLEDVACYINRLDATFWDFPLMRVLSAQNSAKIKELVMFNASMKTNGEFTPPSG